MSKESDLEVRERLAAQGEPCGGFLHQCRNPAAHREYAALPDEQKRLMMEESEARIMKRTRTEGLDMNKEEAEEIARRLTKQLSDQGKLIEAGWAVFALYAIPEDAPEIQRQEMQLAYMAGAEHLFSSIMVALDPGEEETDADLKRMELIQAEIDKWREKLSKWVGHVEGHA